MLRINVSAINHHFFTLGIFAKKRRNQARKERKCGRVRVLNVNIKK
jgi:hypothetical protein